jgi:hypothetical protein
MTISVNNVDIIKPPISAIAIGEKNELPDNAIGTSPMTVVVVVNIIGLNRLETELIHAS